MHAHRKQFKKDQLTRLVGKLNKVVLQGKKKGLLYQQHY